MQRIVPCSRPCAGKSISPLTVPPTASLQTKLCDLCPWRSPQWLGSPLLRSTPTACREWYFPNVHSPFTKITQHLHISVSFPQNTDQTGLIDSLFKFGQEVTTIVHSPNQHQQKKENISKMHVTFSKQLIPGDMPLVLEKMPIAYLVAFRLCVIFSVWEKVPTYAEYSMSDPNLEFMNSL
jgi:hypothetical protein